MSRESMTGQEPIFSSWNASVPPAEFASRVALLASEEHGRGTRHRRGLVIPILLAALFVSFGAAAAWDSLVMSGSQRLVDEPVSAPMVQDARELQWVSAASLRQPKSIPEIDIPKKLPVSRVNRQLVELEPPPAAGEPERSPTKLHLPRCECGVSAIICTCIE